MVHYETLPCNNCVTLFLFWQSVTVGAAMNDLAPTPFADCLVIGCGQRGQRHHTRSLVSHTHDAGTEQKTRQDSLRPRAASHKTFYGQKGKRAERASVRTCEIMGLILLSLHERREATLP